MRKKKKKKAGVEARGTQQMGRPAAKASNEGQKRKVGPAKGQPRQSSKKGKRKRKIRPPTTGEVTVAQLMAEARRKIKLGDLGIAYLRPKIAATGAMLLEVHGEGSAATADLLAAKLREVLADTGARIARPVKCEELRVAGLDEIRDKGGGGGCWWLRGRGCPRWEHPQGPLRPGHCMGAVPNGGCEEGSRHWEGTLGVGTCRSVSPQADEVP